MSRNIGDNLIILDTKEKENITAKYLARNAGVLIISEKRIMKWQTL